jgi:hypothetical protein
MVNVDTSLGVWRNQFCDDKSLNQTLDWLLNGVNRHARVAYYKIPDKEQEYVFFVNVGVQEEEMPGVKTAARATFEEFWKRAQRCRSNEFSESASMRLSIGQAIGALSAVNVPPFISLCPDIIPNLEAEAVQHIRLHNLRSKRPTEGPETLSTKRTVHGLYGARTIISMDEAMAEAMTSRPKLTMEEAIAAGPYARITRAPERKRAITAELFDKIDGSVRMVTGAKPAWKTITDRYAVTRESDDHANPHVQAMIAQRAAHLQRTAEYTPEQQEDIWAARVMAGSYGKKLLHRLKLPSHLLQ